MERSLALCVCTRERADMLRKCLESVFRQRAVPGWIFDLIVVENDVIGHSRAIVNADHDFPGRDVVYVHEPELGIPFARNAAIEEALRRNADWIAFIDDDEELASDWLSEMVAAIENHEADVISAPVKYESDCAEDLWIPDEVIADEGADVYLAATNNVALHRTLVVDPPTGYGLRFDEELRFSGGEDTDFFLSAYEAGARLVWSNRPKVIERQTHSGRRTFRWYFQRMMTHGWHLANRAIRRRGQWEALKFYGVPALRMISTGPRIALAAPYWCYRGGDFYRRRLKKKVTKLAIGIGYLYALVRIPRRPYQSVDGH